MSNIPLYTQTSYDWHCNKNQPNKPYAVDLNVGTNEYIFGRTTPDNKFIVSTGLINDPKPFGIQMVGGKKGSSKKDSSKKDSSKKDSSKKVSSKKDSSKKVSSKKGSSKKGGSSPFKLMNDSGIYNEKNYMNNELIYNALTKSAELKGVNGAFTNSMIDAQNNIMSGGNKKKTTKSKKKTTKSKKIVKPMTKTTKSKKIVKPMTKITKSKKSVKPMTKITKSTKTKKITTKPKIKKEKTIKNKIKNLFK